ncbi:hypothetical protein K435DRAFT_814823 [Dendrothele bispora CBS 962.96]|uniref:Uncharacterized protein n=1 Tax=Dendrothele bispora (strain CBS 962.96) TaxID=1314807 RepID=A0A4S8MY90_DENBC|nr:hypothetical protein K435DRAFT_814823 [Dendrothele bispora CBS 962.96]
MPNIISLPFGKCPPLHLQASSWRHLLKLMARLSGTKVEPSIEAIANKVDPILRTIVQVVRPHHTSPEWRTVVWFTIDHPVPTNKPVPRKYLNGDVDALPYSYTLGGSLPALLRDSADTAISKTYTIPSTENLPYPVLPISFPNLALYLTAALEEARRYMNDSSSGIRKLAKMIDTCYPGEAPPPSSSGRLRNLFGRGNKNNKNKGRGGNEDTYELVTPFVPDEWG